MFTGVGGFELGLQNEGDTANLQRRWDQNTRSTQNLQREGYKPCDKTTFFSCVGFSEFDKYASQLLSKKFPNIRNYGDATKINPRELPDFDMLCGGFPCQAFSIAGKRRGFEDTRGTMFFEIARILEVKRPKIILLENVKGLLNHEKGKTFTIILQTLDELGYDIQWMVLNSKFFGVPQNRERVFIIGSLRGTSRPEILPFGYTGGKTDGVHIQISGYLYSNGWEKRHESIRRVYDTNGISPTIPTASGGGVLPKISNRGPRECGWRDISPSLLSRDYKEPKAVLTPDRIKKGQNGRRIKELGEPAFTLTGQDIHGVQQGCKIRKLTPTECERLQGFPDGWTEGFSDTQRYKMMGNAVTVNVIKSLGEKILSH